MIHTRGIGITWRCHWNYVGTGLWNVKGLCSSLEFEGALQLSGIYRATIALWNMQNNYKENTYLNEKLNLDQFYAERISGRLFWTYVPDIEMSNDKEAWKRLPLWL